MLSSLTSSYNIVIGILFLLTINVYAQDAELGVAGNVEAATEIESIYICDAGDESYLGLYSISHDDIIDNIPSYINQQKRSIFRSNGFWYIGNLESWPVQTHYRCVGSEGCEFKSDTPPIPGTWTLNKYIGKAPSPVLQTTPCSVGNGDEF